MISERIRALIKKKHGKPITYANLFDEILEIAKAARKEGYNKGILELEANQTGIPLKNVRQRLDAGWSLERALTEPVKHKPQARKYVLIEDNPFTRIKI